MRKIEITKVFTKYDTPLQVINMPYFGNVEPGVETRYIGDIELHPIKFIEGLEGVRIITYAYPVLIFQEDRSI